MTKLLFVASEVYPLIKTGGLADFCHGLPNVLSKMGQDVRILLPYYKSIKSRSRRFKEIAKIQIPGTCGQIRIVEGKLPNTQLIIWLVDYPAAFDRSANPYSNFDGQSWDDNAERFALFSRVAVSIALGQTSISWQPDIVHCNDWQTGLIPALLARESKRPATVFTIHNLAYQGLFPYQKFKALALPDDLWSMEALEFHGCLSFIKGGLVFADMLNTVSPTYAKEIKTPKFGQGLDGLLNMRKNRLQGILNGIDDKIWNPATDSMLTKKFSSEEFQSKQDNKTALQQEFELPKNSNMPLLGLVGRLTYQKGTDFVLEALPKLMTMPLQLVVLGTGEQQYEQALIALSKKYSGQLAVKIGFNETLAHKIEGGADMFVMPSRFEPCGLNQLYSLRYGTVPIVRRVGGLADTVVDANEKQLTRQNATGIVFDQDGHSELTRAIKRALQLYKKQDIWKKLAITGMKKNFSWSNSADQYIKLYDLSLRHLKADSVRNISIIS